MNGGGAVPPRTQIFGGVRGRLLALVAAATIPIAGIAGTNAWNAYQSATEQGLRDVVILREVAAARHGAAVGALREVLTGLARNARLLDVTPAACDAELNQLRALMPDRYSNFSVLDAEGRLLCSALPATRGRSFADQDYTKAVRASRNLVIGEFTTGLVSRRAVLPGAAPILDDQGQLRGIVVGGLYLDFFLRTDRAPQAPDESQVWLLDADGSLLPLGSARAMSLPPPETLAHMLAGPGMTRMGAARDGTLHAWSMEELDPRLRLLVGLSMEQTERNARAAFLRRVLELTVFLLACVVAILVGVELGVSRPLRQLAARVREWRPGRPFPAGPTAGGPQEVRELDRALIAAATALQERETALTAALHQRDLLMAEIHHRVKNNLQVVASLLSLQAGRLRSPAARTEFAVARDRVQALATLHRHLYLHQSFERISLRPFLEELSRQLGDALGAGPGTGVDIAIDAEDVEMASDQAISLALLLTEAVSNAMRHGFPDNRTGTISISLHIEEEMAHLIVADDGVGLGEPSAETDGDGLGLRLIEGVASHLGGAAEITSDGGTRISVRFPLHRRAPEETMRGAA